MDEDDEEERRRANGVHIAQQPTVVDVAHNLLDGVEREGYVGFVVHGKKNAGGDLQHQHEAGKKTEVPPVAKIARCGVAGKFVFDKTGEGETTIHPLYDASWHGDFS